MSDLTEMANATREKLQKKNFVVFRIVSEVQTAVVTAESIEKANEIAFDKTDELDWRHEEGYESYTEDKWTKEIRGGKDE